jgi:hypothetical protein
MGKICGTCFSFIKLLFRKNFILRAWDLKFKSSEYFTSKMDRCTINAADYTIPLCPWLGAVCTNLRGAILGALPSKSPFHSVALCVGTGFAMD